MDYEEVNIWELGERINIKVSLKFLEHINNEIKRRFITKRAVHVLVKYSIPFSTFKLRLKKCYKYFVDLEIFLELCRILNISRFEMQKSIIAYKLRRSHNYIEDPILPIKLTPIFDMLIAHHIADGNVVDPKHNRLPYFSYRNYDPHYMQLYIKKIQSLCGTIKYKNPYQDETRSYCPGPLSAILFKRYNLTTRSFLSTKARIPIEIFAKPKEHLLAFLLAFIVDEGTVDSGSIVIGLKNPGLAADLHRICELLNYKSSYKLRRNDEFGYITILRPSTRDFWNDYLALKKQYPEVDLGRQGKKIEQSFLFSSRTIKQTPGNKDVILRLLSQGASTVNKLSIKIHMTRQGIRYLVHALEHEGKIEKYGMTTECSYVYGLKIEDESSREWYL